MLTIPSLMDQMNVTWRFFDRRSSSPRPSAEIIQPATCPFLSHVPSLLALFFQRHSLPHRVSRCCLTMQASSQS